MVSSSSTRKAARLAQKGKGKRVRFQGGTLFPMVVVGILVVGLATIVYARQSRPAADASPPTIDQHWHIAYGFQICTADNFKTLTGALEEVDSNGQLISDAFRRTGVHSHDDGVIHWHPTTSAAVGQNATLGVFLDVYDVELDDDSLRFPENQGGEEYIEGETKCSDEDAELKVVVWDSYQDTGDGTTYTSDFDDIRISNDAMAITIAFLPSDVDVAMPPSAPNLPELGAVDTPPPDSVSDATISTTAPGATTGTTRSCGEHTGDTRHDDAAGIERTGTHRHRLMRAVVLVGGYGTRLRPLTDTIPKSMLPVAHVPLIARLIGGLERGGVDAVTLALGFRPEPFVEAFPGRAVAPSPWSTPSSPSRSTRPARSASPPTTPAWTAPSSSPTGTCSRISTSARSSPGTEPPGPRPPSTSRRSTIRRRSGSPTSTGPAGSARSSRSRHRARNRAT